MGRTWHRVLPAVSAVAIVVFVGVGCYRLTFSAPKLDRPVLLNDINDVHEGRQATGIWRQAPIECAVAKQTTAQSQRVGDTTYTNSQSSGSNNIAVVVHEMTLGDESAIVCLPAISSNQNNWYVFLGATAVDRIDAKGVVCYRDSGTSETGFGS